MLTKVKVAVCAGAWRTVRRVWATSVVTVVTRTDPS